jgi:hypothetical protein
MNQFLAAPSTDIAEANAAAFRRDTFLLFPMWAKWAG